MLAMSIQKPTSVLVTLWIEYYYPLYFTYDRQKDQICGFTYTGVVGSTVETSFQCAVAQETHKLYLSKPPKSNSNYFEIKQYYSVAIEQTTLGEEQLVWWRI